MSHASDKPDYGNLEANYESVIAALNAKRIANYQLPNSYPANFAGIVAALLDLNWGQASTGPQPPTWDQSGGDYDLPPSEGALWFDTRQGRLFCYAHDGWYQTNGGDGYVTVREGTAPPQPVRGEIWMEFQTKELYVYDGSQFVPAQSSVYVDKDNFESILNASADFDEFKTNLLAFVST